MRLAMQRGAICLLMLVSFLRALTGVLSDDCLEVSKSSVAVRELSSAKLDFEPAISYVQDVALFEFLDFTQGQNLH